MNKQHILFLAILFLSLITACKKEDISPQSPTSAQDLYINQFIWSNMSAYYLWTDSVSTLSYTYFNNDTNKINSFLKGYTDHEKLFKDLTYKRDKWSWIESDYKKLEGELNGNTKSMGYDFGLAVFSNSDNIFGYVRYVLKGSPADKAGVKRGDIFTKVNGQDLTISNYQTLLFGGSDTYTLSFAYISGNSIVSNGKTSTLTAVDIQENPIFLDTVYTINNTKIGYLIYNGFYSNFDTQLNQTFQFFKNSGIQKLILDLRYNGGGSVNSAVYLSSMIYGTYTDKIFCKDQYNQYLNDYLLQQYGSDFFVTKFTDKIQNGTSSIPIISLDLNQLYVITSGSTASASELVINGLKAYIPVTTIGDTTVGKYVGSMTIKDEDAKGNVNPNNSWAMQLIILKIANANGVTNYVKGFAPDVYTKEDLRNMLPLGSTNETVLSAAIATATGQTQTKAARIPLDVKKVADSKDFMPHAKEMYVNLPRIKK